MRSVLLVVLPHRVGTPESDGSKKIVKSFLAFPYGVLTLASYLKRFASNLGAVEILDLNLPTGESPETALKQKLTDMKPDIVGFSMSYDVSYAWLKTLIGVVKNHDEAITMVCGGPATTTAYTEILAECDLDACCYSEGEVAFKNLVEAEDVKTALTQDPWVTKESLSQKRIVHPVYDDLDKIVDVDYSLVEVGAYSMKEAFSPFTKFTTSSKQFFIVTSRGCPFKCLAGDTPVNTIYGDIPIAELAKTVKEVPVFTYDWKTKESKVATAKNIRFTGKEKLVRVAFDDGTYIDCTPDHKFQAFKWGNQHRDGIEWFSEAKDLKKGTHVRAIKFPPAKKNPYPQACWGQNTKAIHLMVAEWKFGRTFDENELVHHIDHNKANWQPSNLELLPNRKAHIERHPEISERMRANNPTKNGVTKEWRNNLSKALTGLKRTEESKACYSAAAIKREEKKRAEFVNHRVLSVTELDGLHDTYCLEVPDTGWFYANNVLVKNCVFCAEPSFHGANMRYVTVDRAVEHITRLKEQYGLSVLTIYDDQILMNKNRAKELFTKLAPLGIRIEMPNGVTLSYIDEEMATVMKAAGVDTIFLAIEHGSKRVLKDIIRKPIAYNRIKPTIQLLQKAGIYCQGFFVIGLPGETRAERQETRDVIKDWGLDWASFSYATPLRGSELYRICKEKGWIEEKYLPIGAIDMTRYVITAPGMDREEIEGTVFDMNLDLNFVNNRNMRVGNYETAKWAFEEVTERIPNQAFANFYLAQAKDMLGEDGTANYEAYLKLVLTVPAWAAAARKFGLESRVTLRQHELPSQVHT